MLQEIAESDTPHVNIRMLQAQGIFTIEDASISREHYPVRRVSHHEFYDVNVLEAKNLVLTQPSALVDMNKIIVEGSTDVSQNHVWRGKLNPEIDNLHRKLERGWELWRPPIILHKTDDEKYTVVDGRTRLIYLREIGHQNVIADILETKDHESDVETSIDDMQMKGNISGHDTRGKANKEDAITFLQSQMTKGRIKKDSHGNPHYAQTVNVAQDVFGDYFTSDTLSEIVNKAMFTWPGASFNIRCFKDKAAVRHWATSDGRHYKDLAPDVAANGEVVRRGIHYFYYDVSQPRNFVKSLADDLDKYPFEQYEYRVLLFQKIPESVNTISKFNKNRDGFISDVNGILTKISKCWFNSAPVNLFNNPNIAIYGMASSIGEVHNLDELILFNNHDDNSKPTWYQKNPPKGVSEDALLTHCYNDDC